MSEATFTLPIPPSVNALHRATRKQKGVYLSPVYKAWLVEAGMKLNVQRVPEISPPYAIEYAVGRPDKRRRDVTNLVKAMDDLLQSQGVITDDCHVDDSRIYWCPQQEAGTVKVTVRTA